MVLVYTQQITPRLQYACNIIFNSILCTEYSLVDSKTDTEININYSNEAVVGSLQIIPNGLLHQKSISNHTITPGEYEDIKTLFHSGEGDFPFDIFSAVFYMCSRYEEYLPFEADEHGRFKAEDSIAYRYGFLQQPVVEIWTKKLAAKIGVAFPENSYKFQLTIDVDDAWKYKNRPIYRNIGGLLRDFFKGNFSDFKNRYLVLLNRIKDPWDTFEYIEKIEKKLSNPIQYFFLLNNTRPYDTAISIKKKQFRNLIYNLQQKKKVGVHPSYVSNLSLMQLRKEYFDLSHIVKNKPQHSRQHFLKISFPDTFRNLIKLGIYEEFSMGWANQVGFRVGISRPFPFYDLEAEKETHLILVPFMAMDRTLKDYMNLSIEESISMLNSIENSVKEVGGQFTLLWHNDSISNCGEWKGWREVFESTLNYAEQSE